MNDTSVQAHKLDPKNGSGLVLHQFGGDGPSLIICHATGFHAHAYLPLVRVLTQEFSVWGLDSRGHGASQIDIEARYSWADHAGDLLSALDHIAEPTFAFGHSMGGATILGALGNQPGALCGAFLYEPIVLTPDRIGTNTVMAANAAKRRANFDSRAQALERYASRPPLNRLRADSLAAYVEHGFIDEPDGTVRLACRPVHESHTFDGAKVTTDSVSFVATAVTVARGFKIDGHPSPADFAEEVADALPHATLRSYPTLSHFGPFEDPDQIATDVAEVARGAFAT